MGFSSYECKLCDHSVLSSSSADPEINSWMKDAVLLGANGSRLICEFDGYSGHYEENVGHDAVWLHQACWEVAGKPEYEDFREMTAQSTLVRRPDNKRFLVASHSEGFETAVVAAKDGTEFKVTKQAPGYYLAEDGKMLEVVVSSNYAGDQGYFFGKEHDMIDPRITDEAERVRLLAEGIEIRERRWYDGRARKVAEWLDTKEREYHDEDKQAEPWRHRFSYHESTAWDEEKNEALLDENGETYKDGFSVWDELSDIEHPDFKGTEEQVKTHLACLWAQFVESDECAAYLARHKELREAAQIEQLAKLKEEGRYKVSYRPAPTGDTVTKEGGRDWTGSRSIYEVLDRLTYETVAVMDGPDKALGVQVFQEKYPEERIEAVHVAHRESAALAKAEAKRLNEQWAECGYPWDDSE